MISTYIVLMDNGSRTLKKVETFVFSRNQTPKTKAGKQRRRNVCLWFSFNRQKEKKQRELLCFLFKQFKRSLKPLSFYRYKHIMCVYILWFHRKWKSLFVWGRGERDVSLHDLKKIIVKDTTNLLYFDLFAGVQSRFCPVSDDNSTCYYRLLKSLLPFRDIIYFFILF